MSDTDPTQSNTRALSTIVTVIVLLVVFVGLALTSMWDKSPTFDESFYVSGGYGYLRTGDPKMASWYHPVLAPVLSGLPLLTLDLEAPSQIMGWNQELFFYAPVFMHYNRTDAQTIIRTSRLGMIPIGVLLGLGVFLWSRRLFGNTGGLLSLGLFVVAPNILAHARLSTTDVTLTTAIFWATFLFHEHLRRPRLLTAFGCGVLAGAAVLAKVSALLMFPAWTALALIHLLKPDAKSEEQRRSSFRPMAEYGLLGRIGALAASVAVMAALAIMVIGAAYRFQYAHNQASVEEESPTEVLSDSESSDATGEHGLHGWSFRTFERVRHYLPLPTEYLHSIHVFLDKARYGHPGYLFGEVGGPWWYYYPVAYLLKTPLGMIILTLLAVVLTPRSARARWNLELLILPVLYMGGCMTSSVNSGYRHVLPMVPFLLVMVGSVATVRIPKVRVLHAVLALLVAWTVWSSLMVYPHYLTHFNELAGGPANGHRFLGDSNYDWGQDIHALGQYLKTQGVEEPVNLFLHTMSVDNLGFPAVDGFRRKCPKPGWYALGTTVMQGIYETGQVKRYSWLLKLKPTTVIGYTIRVYHVSQDDLDSIKEDPGS